MTLHQEIPVPLNQLDQGPVTLQQGIPVPLNQLGQPLAPLNQLDQLLVPVDLFRNIRLVMHFMQK